MSQSHKDKLIYLRQWVGDKVNIKTSGQTSFAGTLTNIVFDGTRLSYIMLDDKTLVNFDHIVEISLQS